MNDTRDLPWFTVARLTNLAEVGYYADLLETQGYATNVDRRDEFSAIDGAWNTRYLLQVKAENGIHAAEVMKDDLVKTGDHTTLGTDLGDEPNLPRGNFFGQSGLFYRAAISIVVIGFALLVAERMSRSRIGLSSTDDALWEAVEHLQAELRSSNAAGPDARMFHEKSSDTILLIDDVNRDGRFDRLRQFRNGRLIETVER